MIPAAIITLFYLPVHLVVGVTASERFKHPVSQFVTVLAWPVVLPVARLFGVRPRRRLVTGIPLHDAASR